MSSSSLLTLVTYYIDLVLGVPSKLEFGFILSKRFWSFSLLGEFVNMFSTIGAPHMWLTPCFLMRSKIIGPSNLRRQILVWNIGIDSSFNWVSFSLFFSYIHVYVCIVLGLIELELSFKLRFWLNHDNGRRSMLQYLESFVYVLS